MDNSAEISLGKREFVHINQIDMETRRVCSTTTEEGTTTTILPQSSKFENELEDQKLRKRNSFKIMLAAQIAIGKREFVHVNQIDMETRRVCSTTTEEGTTTTILPQNSKFENELEDQKLRKRKRRGIVHTMQRRSQDKKKKEQRKLELDKN